MFLIAMIALALFALPPGWGLAAVSLGIVVEIAEVGFWVRFLRRYRISSGPEALIGTRAQVIEACDPEGRVRIRGEIWRARCSSQAEVGEQVTVTGLDGLTLEVDRPGPPDSV